VKSFARVQAVSRIEGHFREAIRTSQLPSVREFFDIIAENDFLLSSFFNVSVGCC